MYNKEAELNLKLKLESRFKPQLRFLFNTIQKDFFVSLMNKDGVISASHYKDRWSSILKGHYELSQKRILRLSSPDLSQRDDTDESRLKFLILALLSEWRDKEATEKTKMVVETTNDNIKDAISEAGNLLREDNKIVNNRTIAAVAAVLLRRKFKKRVETIAITETQNPVEDTKQIVAGTVSSVLGVKIEKIWRTVGDNKVRAAHVAADSQRALVSSWFMVMGEKLMHPGDRSGGASAGNIIRCRCSSEIISSAIDDVPFL